MRPSRRLLRLLGVWLLLALVAVPWPTVGVPLWGVVGAVLALAVLVDWLRVRATPAPVLTREVANSLALNNSVEVALRLHNSAHRAVHTQVFDGVPTAFPTEGLPGSIRLPPETWGELRYRLRPVERGVHQIGAAHVLIDGPWRLLRRSLMLGEPSELKVYPDFRQVARYALLALDNRLGAMGIHQRQRRGEGLEFFQLREYRPGDAMRQVDWKATSRRQQLISREYQDEQNQQVVFLLDCGRRMRTKEGELSHFDHVLNAVLLLSYVGLRQGDAVGFMTFSGQDRWLPAMKGTASMNTLLNRVYDLETTLAPSDYLEAAQRLLARQRRRALVILVCNLRDEDSDELHAAVTLLRRRHLVLLASLREGVFREVLEKPVMSFEDALRVAATHRALKERVQGHKSVSQRGVVTLDVEPAKLPVALVNRYLEIKRSGRL